MEKGLHVCAKLSGGILLAVILTVLGVSGCPNPEASIQDGWLIVSLTDAPDGRTLAPSISMLAKSYRASGTGPGGATFTQPSGTVPITIKGLAAGTWTVTADALNADGTSIFEATGTAKVVAGKSVTINLTLVPLVGTGTLDLTVNWTAGDLTEPSILASLTKYGGTANQVAFVVLGNQARCTSATPTGYFTLSLQLLDHGIAVTGAVEVVRIVKDQTTTGVFTFDKVNKVDWTGTLIVNITPDMADPIPVTISGVPTELTAGSTAAAGASVGDGTSGVVYVWYLNGIAQAPGETFTFGTGLDPGYYRLDVLAFAAGGTRAGSATASFRVIEAPIIGSAMMHIRARKATS